MTNSDGKMATEKETTVNLSLAGSGPNKTDTPLFKAINHRILFNTKKEGENFIDTPLKDIKKINEKAYQQGLARLDTLARQKCDVGLEELNSRYFTAAERFMAKKLAGREEMDKKYSIRLMEWAFAATNPEAKDKAKRVKGKEDYMLDIFRTYMTEPGGEEEIDVCFTVLMHWNIIRPGIRPRDYENGEERNENMLCLLKALKEELPGMGILESLPAIDMTIAELQHDIAEGMFPSSAEYWSMLQRIAGAMLTISSPEHFSTFGLQTYALKLKGIWLDNSDNGNSRFWIFPKNRQSAFCFHEDESGEWSLHPYEFFTCTYDLDDDSIDNDYCVWFDMSESLNLIKKPGARCNPDRIVYFRPVLTTDIDGDFDKIGINPMREGYLVNIGWSEFYRIRPNDKRYSLFEEVLDNVDDISNEFKDIINTYNSIVGVDRVNIYLADRVNKENVKFIIRHDSEEDSYSYCAKEETQIPHSIMDCLDDGRFAGKLYRLPRKNNVTSEKIEAERLERLEQAISDTNLESQITIYSLRGKDTTNTTDIIFFNDYSIGMTIDEAKKIWGLESLKLRKR